MRLPRALRKEKVTNIFKPIKPPLHWFGGKSTIAGWVTSHLPPRDSYDAYVEPFGGLMSVLLALPPDKTSEIYNDMNGDLVNFWRTLRNDTLRDELIHQILTTPYSRDEFAEALQWQDLEMNVERCRRWLIICVQGVGSVGKFFNRKTTSAWSIPKGSKVCASHVYRWSRLPERLIPLAERVKDVVVENVSWEKMLERYDSPRTLFYVDPPYVSETEGAKFGKYYAKAAGNGMPIFGEKQQMRLLDALCAVRGKVALSGFNIKMYREILQGWRIEEREITLAQGIMAGGLKRPRVECLWMNYNR